MKAFLQHDDSGLFYQADGEWSPNTLYALEFATATDAERFRSARNIPGVHPVLRIDPQLLTRMSSHAPGVYQVGE